MDAAEIEVDEEMVDCVPLPLAYDPDIHTTNVCDV